MGFLGHNSGSKFARKSIKGSKDANVSLVSKHGLILKNGSLVWRQGPGKFGQKGKIMPLLLRHQQKPPNPNQNFF